MNRPGDHLSIVRLGPAGSKAHISNHVCPVQRQLQLIQDRPLVAVNRRRFLAIMPVGSEPHVDLEDFKAAAKVLEQRMPFQQA